DQTLEMTAAPTGLTVVRKRPGQANEVRTAPASTETVEDADQARLAVHWKKDVAGFITDAEDLTTYKLKTTVSKPTERTLAGVKVKLFATETISEKEKVPVSLYLKETGEVVEVDFGGQMRAVAEPETVAKRQDQVEVFGLTRVVLPKALPDAAQRVPGSLTLVMNGLPERFWRNNYRQKFKALPDGRVEVTITANPPKLEKKLVRPLWDPNGGVNLKSTFVVESDNPQIQALSKKIVGGEKDAYVAAKKISAWVEQNIEKDYGASSDRATDVLRQMKGDCTEHSLLAVALLRAAGIPSKRVDGVVYLRQEDGVPALYWHEWVEAWVGEWTQLDPTFGQDVADATHFAVGEEGNAEIIPLIGQMKVVEVR
ncbi:MAG TPA: transglutaminase-like domain-containing protein, partial [Myxococcaceae bacterium]|nr:transglutaminase-like domain-containing protein [Myxococcaceae bacterium]